MNKTKYDWLQKTCITVCLLVSVFAIAIIVLVINVRAEIDARYLAMTETLQAREEMVANYSKPKTPMQEVAIPEATIQTQPIENVPEPIENLQEEFTKWFLENESTEPITIWKKSDEEGHLLVALKDENGEVLCTFKYEDVVSDCKEWELCDYYLGETTLRDIIDLSYLAYHEVTANNLLNTQVQMATALNRVLFEYYPDNIRGVITEPYQYSSAPVVTNRMLKDDNFLEEEDLEKCFKQSLLVLAGEMIEEVPRNVVYAAGWVQGSGVWKVIDGTYYCYY